jgi:ribosomal protein S27AE
MGTQNKTCPKCGGRMGAGFQLDHADSPGKKAAEWVEGPAEKGWFGAIKLRGRARIGIESWRCARCFYLESYAPAP